VAQHQSQCSIFANQQLKVSNIFLCSYCFWPTATRLSFRCWPTLINTFTDCFHRAKLPIFFRKFCNNRSVSKTKFLQCLDPSFIFLRYFTHNNCGYDLKYWKIYYNAMLHVNIKIMTSQQMWYLLLSYFNNINLSKWHHHHHHHHHRHVTFPPKHLPAHFAFH